MQSKNDTPEFYAKSGKEWRKWLEKNHHRVRSVRLILYRQKSKNPSVGYGEAVEHALCYGWIDSVTNKRDDESFYQCFTPRKSQSTWSKINRARAAKMIKAGLMTPAGMAMINLAKKKGTWNLLKDADNEIIPDDLQKLFNKNRTAFKNFQGFAPSSKRLILGWIIKAKQPETRARRIAKTVELAAQNSKANHPVQASKKRREN